MSIPVRNVIASGIVLLMCLPRGEEIDERLDIEKMKLEDSEEQHAERMRVAREKLAVQKAKNEKKK